MRMTATQYLKAVLSFVGVVAVTVIVISTLIVILRFDVFATVMNRLMSLS
jgi:hypothetical protein